MKKDFAILTNKPIPSYVEEVVDGMLKRRETPLFIVVGDLDLQGHYRETALIFTAEEVIYCSDNGEETEMRCRYAEMHDVKAKRMYGNATLSAIMPDGRRKVFFRYTHSLSSAGDAAARFINQINSGATLRDEMAVIGVTFETLLNICPKCGHTLLHSGATCIVCRSKVKVVKKLLQYIRPQFLPIFISIVLSLVGTVLTLIPPSVTGYIVDVVFSGKQSEVRVLNWVSALVGSDNKTLLMTLVVILLMTHMLNCGVGILRGYLMRMAGDKSVVALRNDIYRKAQYLPMKFYDGTSVGSVINRIAGDSATLQQFLLNITKEAVAQAFQMVGIIFVMVALNPGLSLLSLVPVAFIAIAARIFSKMIKPLYRRAWKRWTAVFSVLSDTIPCIRVIKSFTGEKRAAEKFEQRNQEWLDTNLKIA